MLRGDLLPGRVLMHVLSAWGLRGRETVPKKYTFLFKDFRTNTVIYYNLNYIKFYHLFEG